MTSHVKLALLEETSSRQASMRVALAPQEPPCTVAGAQALGGRAGQAGWAPEWVHLA